MSESTYECKTCKQMCEGNREELRSQCHMCRLTQMKEKYMKRKLEIKQELKKVIKKKKAEGISDSDSEEYYSDEISCSDNESDKDFIPDSEVKSKKKSLITKNISNKVKRKLTLTQSPEPTKK